MQIVHGNIKPFNILFDKKGPDARSFITNFEVSFKLPDASDEEWRFGPDGWFIALPEVQ